MTVYCLFLWNELMGIFTSEAAARKWLDAESSWTAFEKQEADIVPWEVSDGDH